ncbi:putrescine hydroxycinnamoyltransferase 1-like [Triticum dicoccoides]|uniref:putrescine hydroxycinnamoyltransferase 1-like n=1 Tax=Triticum dicoccoides TaxID=85692 RepID=UPI0018905C5D|nr:putrescine hydroxycinnamoyltransferase 1-like [Triticum dicoccoides]
MCAARRLPPDATTRLTFPANVRRLLRPPLPARYFGNAIITLGTAGKVRDIGSEELASVAGRINGAVRRMDDELVRSAIDYLEMNGGKQPAGTLPETELRVFSWLGMPMYDADFGWGKPLAMHRALEERDGLSGGVRIPADRLSLCHSIPGVPNLPENNEQDGVPYGHVYL